MAKTVGGGGGSFLWNALRARLKRAIFGNPLATSVHLEHRLPIYIALPVFASDAISSVAYGPQEILAVLATVSYAALHDQLWISLVIAGLMLIVATSYRRAVRLYPTSGGSYTVTKSNLGQFLGLLAAAALLIDYIMTVAVSVSSGIDALTSALPVLAPEHVWLAIVLVAFMTLVNLRGTRESGFLFAMPMYTFAAVVGIMVISTGVKFVLATLGHHALQPLADPQLVPNLPAHLQLPTGIIRPAQAGEALGLFILLRAFANGCSAMTGVEAVSNGVSAFQPPEAKNAAKTLSILVVVLIFLFLGTAFAAHVYHALPTATGETVLSQVARATFGYNFFYYVTQFATLAILMVAANTSYAGFPRLLAIVAKDNFAPKAFVTQGDRLVYNRGILALAIVSALIIWHFKANVTALIGMYSIGVFLCFTLSQLGMAKKIRDMREKGWRQAALINVIGAFVTGVVTVVVALTKFQEGAKYVLALIPIIIGVCYLMHRHYDWFDKTMTVHSDDYNPLADTVEPLTVLVLVSSDIHRGILEGLECGRAIADGKPNSILRAVHIEMDPEKTVRLRTKWATFVEPYLGRRIRLDIVPSPYRWLIEPVMEYLDQADVERSGDRVIIILPEFETGSLLTQFLHNFTARRLRATLLNRPHITVVSSRYFMKPLAWRQGRGGLVY
ncbi:MAG TPA: APC family permease [Armatimonadota bacterium]|jgi:amino acid transporter